MSRSRSAYVGATITEASRTDSRLIITLRNVRRRFWSSGARLTFGGVADLISEDPRATSPSSPPIGVGWSISMWDAREGETSFQLTRHVGPGEWDYHRFVVRHATVEHVSWLDLRATLRRLLGLNP